MKRKLIVLQRESDRKIVPKVSMNSLRKMASISLTATAALKKMIELMLSITLTTLRISDSTYYLDDVKMTKDEITAIARTMKRHAFESKNTRIRKRIDDKKAVYDILQISAQINAALKNHLKRSVIFIKILQQDNRNQQLNNATIQLERDDHSKKMSKICEHLTKAIRFAANVTQVRYIMNTLESFTTENLEAYRKSMKRWVENYNLKIESIFGFVELYRNPYDVKCEWRDVISIVDPQQTAKLTTLVNSFTKFIRTLSWAMPNVNDGKGSFEKFEFQTSHFFIVHGLLSNHRNSWLFWLNSNDSTRLRLQQCLRNIQCV